MSEAPFTISITDQQLETLRRKLELSVFPDELEDVGWKYGTPLADIKRLVQRWTHGYDWRKHEKELNDEMPMFTRDIDVDGFGTLNIHYVHKKSDVADAIPLLFCHGCKFKFCHIIYVCIECKTRAWQLLRSPKVASTVDCIIPGAP
jgi:hypothetical protein